MSRGGGCQLKRGISSSRYSIASMKARRQASHNQTLNEEADEEFIKALTEEIQIRTQPGLITGKGDGTVDSELCPNHQQYVS
jgi:hypothetical protein